MFMSNATAGWLYDIENALVDSGILNQEYKFKDHRKASELFRNMNNNLALSFPVMINKEIEIKGALFTPYNANVIYKNYSSFSVEEVEAYQGYIYSYDNVNYHCKDIYETNFFEANDYSLNITILDIDDNEISHIKIDHKICDLYNTNINDIIEW